MYGNDRQCFTRGGERASSEQSFLPFSHGWLRDPDIEKPKSDDPSAGRKRKLSILQILGKVRAGRRHSFHSPFLLDILFFKAEYGFSFRDSAMSYYGEANNSKVSTSRKMNIVQFLGKARPFDDIRYCVGVDSM